MTDMEIFMSVVTAIGAIVSVVMWSRYQKRKESEAAEKIKQMERHKKETEEKTKQIEIQENEAAEKTKQMERQKEEAEEKTRQMEIEASSKIEIERRRKEQDLLQLSYMAMQVLADSHPDQFSDYESPIRNIAKTMENSDTMSVEDIPDKIPADMVKKCGPRRAPRREGIVTYADGSYIVNSRRYDEGEIVLEQMQGSTRIKAYLSQLDENDLSNFIASVDRHEKEDELPFSLDLQLNVIHTKRKLKHAVVIGEGLSREGKKCLPLDDILRQ